MINTPKPRAVFPLRNHDQTLELTDKSTSILCKATHFLHNMEYGQVRRRWSPSFAAFLHKTHQLGPSQPPFCISFHMRIASLAINHMKTRTFNRHFVFQINFSWGDLSPPSISWAYRKTPFAIPSPYGISKSSFSGVTPSNSSLRYLIEWEVFIATSLERASFQRPLMPVVSY